MIPNTGERTDTAYRGMQGYETFNPKRFTEMIVQLLKAKMKNVLVMIKDHMQIIGLTKQRVS